MTKGIRPRVRVSRDKLQLKPGPVGSRRLPEHIEGEGKPVTPGSFENSSPEPIAKPRSLTAACGNTWRSAGPVTSPVAV